MYELWSGKGVSLGLQLLRICFLSCNPQFGSNPFVFLTLIVHWSFFFFFFHLSFVDKEKLSKLYNPGKAVWQKSIQRPELAPPTCPPALRIQPKTPTQECTAYALWVPGAERQDPLRPRGQTEVGRLCPHGLQGLLRVVPTVFLFLFAPGNMLFSPCRCIEDLLPPPFLVGCTYGGLGRDSVMGGKEQRLSECLSWSFNFSSSAGDPADP